MASASCVRRYVLPREHGRHLRQPLAIRRFNLHTGDSIEGEIRTPKDGERYFALVKVDKVNADAPEASSTRSCSRTSRRCIRTRPSSSSAI